MRGEEGVIQDHKFEAGNVEHFSVYALQARCLMTGKSTTVALKENAKKVFYVSTGQRKENKETWWWKVFNEEVSKEKVM